MGPRLPFLIRSVFFVSKGNIFDVYFAALKLVLVPCGGGSSAHVYARGRKQWLRYCSWGVWSLGDSRFLIRSVFFVSKTNLFDVY